MPEPTDDSTAAEGPARSEPPGSGRVPGEVYGKIDQVATLVEAARSMPMSGSCVLNRGELDHLLRVVSETEVLAEASRAAERVVADAQAQAGQVRLETNEYVERKLVAFEDLLRKSLAAVEHGRQTVAQRTQADSVQIELDQPPVRRSRGRSGLRAR